MRETLLKSEVMALTKLAIDSFPLFLRNYVHIKDEQQNLAFKMVPWDWQIELAESLSDPDKRFHCILKGRQLGLTWIMAAFAVWYALRPNSNVLILSKREDEAQKALSRAEYIYMMLPKWLRPDRLTENKGELTLGHNWDAEQAKYLEPSLVVALPATKDAGRSLTASLVITDEWAFHPYADENWTAIAPTVRMAGRFVGVSTANGSGNLFEETYWKAQNGENNFTPHFYNCYERPGFTEEMYEDAKKDASDMRSFHQEYPRFDSEAFAASGGCIFDLERLEHMLSIAMETENLPVPPTHVQLLDMWQKYDLEIYELPNKINQYVCGTDVAKGQTEDSDYSCSVIMNAQTKKVAAILHGHIDMDEFAGTTVNLLKLYNFAFWGPETNGGFGDAVLLFVKDQYPDDRIYHWTDPTSSDPKKSKRKGWNTSQRSKPMMESRMKAAVKYGDVVIGSARLIREMKSYVEHPSRPGRTGAVGKNHDDRVVAAMIAYFLSFEPEALKSRRPRPQADTSQRAFRRRR